MIGVSEIYRGREVRVRPTKDRHVDQAFDVRGNGKPAAFAMRHGRDAGAEILAQLKRDLDSIDERAAAGDYGWEPHYYAPGTYEVCEYGHARGSASRAGTSTACASARGLARDGHVRA